MWQYKEFPSVNEARKFEAYQKPIDLRPLGEYRMLKMITLYSGEGPWWTSEYPIEEWRKDMGKIPAIQLPEPKKVSKGLRVLIQEKYTVEYNKAEWTEKIQQGRWKEYRPK